MRVLGMLAAWGVLAVLGTMCFALGGSLGYRRGVKDTLTQIRERRTGSSGCRPLPANHLRRRTSGHARPGARARRARWRPRSAGAPVAGLTHAAVQVRRDPRLAVLSAIVAAILLLGVPGTAISATTAQPGESLYRVRRNLEKVRLAVARGAEDTEVHVELAAARLIDLQGLVGDDVGHEVIADVSSSLGAHATAASRRLTGVEDDDRRVALALELRHVVGSQVEVMDDIVNLDCGDDADGDCEALSETRDGSVALRLSTERDVAVAEGAPDPPPRTVVQADNEGVTAVEVEEPDPDATAATTGSDPPAEDAPDQAGQGAGDAATAPAAVAAPANTAEPDGTAAKPSSKPSTKPTSAPSPTSSPTPTSSATPTAPAESPATELEAPTAGKGAAAGGGDSAGSDAAGQ